MELRELIELGNQQAGEQKALARILGVAPTVLADAKAQRRGLPEFACFRLANYIRIDPATVTAASALVTEKDEEKRKVFYPFVMGRAATIAALTVIIGMTALPSEAQAAQAFTESRNGEIGIMSNAKRMIRRLFQRLNLALQWLNLQPYDAQAIQTA